MEEILYNIKKYIINSYILSISSENKTIQNINSKLFDLMIYLYSINSTIINDNINSENDIDSDAETVIVNESEISESEISESEICESEISKSDISDSEISKSDISKSEINKSKICESNVKKRKNYDSDECSDSDNEPLAKKKKYNYDLLLNDLFGKDLDKVMSFTNLICLYRIFYDNKYFYIITPTNNIKDKIISLNKQYECNGRIIVIGIYSNYNFIHPSREYKAYRGLYNINYNIVELLKKNKVLFESTKYIIDNNNNEFWKDKKKIISLDKNENEEIMWKYFYL